MVLGFRPFVHASYTSVCLFAGFVYYVSYSWNVGFLTVMWIRICPSEHIEKQKPEDMSDKKTGCCKCYRNWRIWMNTSAAVIDYFVMRAIFVV